MVRIGLFGKRVPVLGIALLVVFPVLGMGLGSAVVPGGAVGPADGLGLTLFGGAETIAVGGGSFGEPTPDQSNVASKSPVRLATADEGIAFVGLGNDTKATISDGGTSFWVSTTIDASQAGSTFELWLDLENQAVTTKNARLVLKSVSPLEVIGTPVPTPGGGSLIKVGQEQQSVPNVWIVRVGSSVKGATEVAEEPIDVEDDVTYRTDRVVADRNHDGAITAADFDYHNTDVADGASGIESVSVHEDGTATLYLNGTTNVDGVHDTVSYQSGSYLVVTLHIPEDIEPGSYALQGEIQTLK